MKVIAENTEAQNKEEQDTKVHAFTNVGEIIGFTNDNLGDTMYIGERDGQFIPEKKNIGRCYRTDFTLKTKKEAQKILDEKAILISPQYKNSDFFVYNERTNEMVPFKKNDFIMFDHGEWYLTFDGTSYIYYDDNGYKVNESTYYDDQEPNVEDIPEVKNRKEKKSKK